MIWRLSFLLIARLTKLSPSYKLSAVSGFILVSGVWDAGSKGADVGIKKHQTQWDQFLHTVSIPRPCIPEGQWWYRMTVCPKRGGNARRSANSLLLWLSFLTASFLGTRKSLQNCLCQLYLYVCRDNILRCHYDSVWSKANYTATATSIFGKKQLLKLILVWNLMNSQSWN